MKLIQKSLNLFSLYLILSWRQQWSCGGLCCCCYLPLRTQVISSQDCILCIPQTIAIFITSKLLFIEIGGYYNDLLKQIIHDAFILHTVWQCHQEIWIRLHCPSDCNICISISTPSSSADTIIYIPSYQHFFFQVKSENFYLASSLLFLLV